MGKHCSMYASILYDFIIDFFFIFIYMLKYNRLENYLKKKRVTRAQNSVEK